MKCKIHWCLREKKWTSHTYKSCTKASRIFVQGDWITEAKPDKKQNPRGWVATDHWRVCYNPTDKSLEGWEQLYELIFDKQKVRFNIDFSFGSTALLFEGKRCFVMRYIPSSKV